MSSIKKFPLFFLFFITITAACTITINTYPPTEMTGDIDEVATQRTIKKQTIQALTVEAQKAENESQEQSSGEGPSNTDGAPQPTQAPPTAPPPDFSDVLLPTADFKIIDTQTPIVPPKFPSEPGKLPVIPTYSPEPYAGGSLVVFNVKEDCGRYLALQFYINNQSTIPLESAFVTCHNATTSNVAGFIYENAPFHSQPNQCPPGDARIKAGTNSYIVVYMSNIRLKSGENFYCSLSVYPVDLPANQSGLLGIHITSPQFTAP